MKPSFTQVMMYAVTLAVSVITTQKASARYETCYEQEYKCSTRYEQVCSNERVCSWVPGGQQCSQERVCENRPSGPQECRDQQICHVNPDGSRECHTEQVCRPGSPGGQDCHYEQRCEQTPGREECRNDYQCRQEPRQECGYQTVPKQCWVEDPPPYNPPQPPPYNPPEPPPYNPPQPPPYNPPEPPPYNPPQPPPYNPPADPSIPAAIGEKTITGLRLKIFSNLTAQVVFKDVGQKATKFKTGYMIMVYDEMGDLVISQKVASNGLVDQKINLNNRLTLDQDYTLNLVVTRAGGQPPKKYTFTKTFVRPGPNH